MWPPQRAPPTGGASWTATPHVPVFASPFAGFPLVAQPQPSGSAWFGAPFDPFAPLAGSLNATANFVMAPLLAPAQSAFALAGPQMRQSAPAQQQQQSGAAFLGFLPWPDPLMAARPTAATPRTKPIDMTRNDIYQSTYGTQRTNRTDLYASSAELVEKGYKMKPAPTTPPPVSPPPSAPAVEAPRTMEAPRTTERSVMSSSDAPIEAPPRPPSPTSSTTSSRRSGSTRSGTSSARRAQGMMFKPPAQAGSKPSSRASPLSSPRPGKVPEEPKQDVGMSM
eukprot:Tamp_05572.p1 GENE.Tamp_05572~~Tamp_05572.p1  ORF type:complete len:280 (+),score=23.80 Tamp_05572:2-841(+)